MSSLFSGVIAYPVTPMHPDGSLHLNMLSRLVDGLIDGGVKSVIPLGSTGEFAYLSSQERNKVAEATVEICKNRVPAIIGTSALTTKDAIDYSRHAEKIGADGIMLSIPTYYGLNDEEVYRHIEAVAASVDIPMMLYNNPFTSAVDLNVDLIKKLIKIENLVAIKEATMDVNRISLMKHEFGDRFEILGGGFDPYAFSALSLGASGWTTGMANLIPEKCVELFNCVVVDRNLERGREIHFEIFALANLLVKLGLTKAVKAGLQIIGLDTGNARQPLGKLSPQDYQQLEKVLEKLVVK